MVKEHELRLYLEAEREDGFEVSYSWNINIVVVFECNLSLEPVPGSANYLRY